MTKYVLTMTEEQARQVVDALNFWMRMRMGQWTELFELCSPCELIAARCKRRDEAERILLQARNIIMPELKDMNSLAGSHGVYSMMGTERAFNVMKAIRSCIAWHKKPEGGITVDFDKPMPIHVDEPMPECEAVDDEA